MTWQQMLIADAEPGELIELAFGARGQLFEKLGLAEGVTLTDRRDRYWMPAPFGVVTWPHRSALTRPPVLRIRDVHLNPERVGCYRLVSGLQFQDTVYVFRADREVIKNAEGYIELKYPEGAFD